MSVLTVCGVRYIATFDPDGCDGPCLTLTTCDSGSGAVTYTGTRDYCGKNYAVFSFGDVTLCTDATDCVEGPAGNVLQLRVAWGPCVNPDYTGPGWYCTADCNDQLCEEELECVYYSTDPGTVVTLCSGPYEEESDCMTACGGGTLSPCAVCSEVVIPDTLHVNYVSGGGTPLCSPPDPVKIVRGVGDPDWWSFNNSTYNGGSTGCFFIGAHHTQSGGGVSMRCVSDVYVVNFSWINTTTGVYAESHSSPATVVSCDPFCALFTVPADSQSATDTVFSISASPGATCDSSVIPTYLGTATATGVNSATATLATKDTDPGDLLIVSVTAIVPVGVGAEITSVDVTYDDVTVPFVTQESFAANTAIVGQVEFHDLKIDSPTTGDIVASVVGVGAVVVSLTAIKVAGLSSRVVDQGVGDTGLASQPDSGLSGHTTSQSSFVYAAVAQFRVGTPDAGAWSGVTAGQTVLSGSGSLRLSDAGEVLSAIDTFDAALSVSDVPTVWVALAGDWI